MTPPIVRVDSTLTSISALLSCALLAACGTHTPSQFVPSGVAYSGHARQIERPTTHSSFGIQNVRANFKLIYSFKGGTADGAYPQSQLLYVHGILYGTTPDGGANNNGFDGTAFSVTPDGKEKVLHSFGVPPDGRNPAGGLIDLAGTLYGVTANNGLYYGGTVYSLKGTHEKTLYALPGNPGPADPNGPLLAVGDHLYGTSRLGGIGCGTVFRVSRRGKSPITIHEFGQNQGDGCSPQSGLINVNGTLYGTTYNGGGASPQSFGTVYKISSSGVYSVIYNFGSTPDGRFPIGGLVYLDGYLYGTTNSGGDSNSDGTVFRLSRDGKREKVIHQFDPADGDGANPHAGLTVVGEHLYGVTDAGGGGSTPSGTVFSLTKSGTEVILHSFVFNDGSNPDAPLVYANARLYGTTSSGGGNSACPAGCGVVFSVAP